ncbi:hypothetical protein HYFRA_00004446 [Hymenoscyphus fraxineus]|uniref:Uncharacterized protein n=1 Tax=Hymenoscyphus fraxineus TaxID=746836 RepID=A0A9N9PUH4_9HELO|nr:hypothetical protein HYFRA_00004446 [Hymenoscyphus fraxineus]
MPTSGMAFWLTVQHDKAPRPGQHNPKRDPPKDSTTTTTTNFSRDEIIEEEEPKMPISERIKAFFFEPRR